MFADFRVFTPILGFVIAISAADAHDVSPPDVRQKQTQAEFSPDASEPKAKRPAPPDARVYFIAPHDGDVVSPTFTVLFGLKNMGVAPAGVNKPNTGHHHLIIDEDAPSPDNPIPNDPNHLHFGGGQTEKTITLTPGKHTLQLVLADDLHIQHDPPVVSQRITVLVATPQKASPKVKRRQKRAVRRAYRDSDR